MKFRISIILSIAYVFMFSCSVHKDSEYKSMNKKNIELPYILNLSKNDKNLLYFGTYHSNNINDSLFSEIKRQFNKFNPDFILHEGGTNWPIYKSVDSTILVSGEPGFIIKLAQNNQLPYSNLEPTQVSEYKALAKDYSKKDIVLMYICRQIDQQQRINESNTISNDEFKRNMIYFLGYLKNSGVDLNQEELNFQYWEKVYYDFFKEELQWRDFDPSNYYPNFFKYRLNQINRASDIFRNDFMVQKIIKSFNTYNKVMVLVGGGHLYIQEKKLKEQFK